LTKKYNQEHTNSHPGKLHFGLSEVREPWLVNAILKDEVRATGQNFLTVCASKFELSLVPGISLYLEVYKDECRIQNILN